MVWYFHAGPAGGPPSVNNGALRDHAPTRQAEYDEYQVDYGASTGRTTRWANGYGADFRYQLTDNDRRAVTYTSDVLTEDLEVTGHPVPTEVAPRRGGDPAALVASSDRARTELGWTPAKPGLTDIVADAWEFYRA